MEILAAGAWVGPREQRYLGTKEWVVPFFPINSTASCFELRPGDEGHRNSSSIENPKQINSIEYCFVVPSKGDSRQVPVCRLE